jgi:hypothetical protein
MTTFKSIKASDLARGMAYRPNPFYPRTVKVTGVWIDVIAVTVELADGTTRHYRTNSIVEVAS